MNPRLHLTAADDEVHQDDDSDEHQAHDQHNRGRPAGESTVHFNAIIKEVQRQEQMAARNTRVAKQRR